MDRTSSASPRVIFGVVEVLWRASWSFLGPQKTSKNHNSCSQHVMIRELNYESWTVSYFYHVFSLCVLSYSGMFTTTLRLLKWPWPLFQTVDWLQTPAEVPWSEDLFPWISRLRRFFSSFTRILDKFHPPGALFHSVSCVCFSMTDISSP